MMRKTWYYKLLFSYMPVFFLLVSFLFFIFFQLISERAQKDTSLIYATINNQMMQTVEQSLRSIDHLMVTMQTRTNLSTDFNILNYFDQEGQPTAYFTYQVNKEFDNMRQLNQIIHSVYLVRDSDGYVLSSNTVSPLARFPDKPFIDQLMKDKYSYHWTNVRLFKEFPSSREEAVVSLARKYVTNRGESGLMIVNVQANAIRQLVAQRLEQSTSYLTIEGADGEFVYPSAGADDRERTAISTLVSDYTGWTYESGLLQGGGFTFLQMFANIWVVIALCGVLLGLGSILYMTNRNYKPLRALIAQLDRMSTASGAGSGDKRNEFHYIETTFNALVERFNLFKSQSDLNSGYRKKSIFLEVMNGTRSLAQEEWGVEMERHGLTGGFRQAAVLVLSIDKYADIQSRFTEQDLILYRFIIQNMYMELVQRHGLRSWSEWMSDKEMCGFVYMEEGGQGGLTDTMAAMIEQALIWIRANLPFTVTVGVGQPTDAVPKLKDSYRSAMQAVNSRVVFGNNRMIGYWETEDASSAELYHHLEEIRRLLYAFRLMEPEWRTKYAEVFQQFRTSKLKRDDIVNLLNFMTFQLFEHIGGSLLNDTFIETNKAIVKDVIDRFETLEDVQEDLLGIMDKLEYMLNERADKGNTASIALQMKAYIDEHVSNPDLSLVHLSEQFHIPSKNVSALFKEQFDIKFIDFLIDRRVELAKRLLSETELSVQEVGHRVGYLNPVSFNRVFKRVVGIPPGDYRKERQG